MTSLEDIVSKKYEQVSFFNDEKTGLSAIIAVHNTNLGPALGGCRLRAYSNLESALSDVLGLSEAMSYKNSLCGINFGGGKSAIIKDPNFTENRAEFFQTFGRCVDSMCGKYVTAGDMGTTVYDMAEIAKSTCFVAGTDPNVGIGGDPSPYTARGVFAGMRACLEHKFSNDSFKGKKIAVQGVGKTGYYLVELLAEAGAKLFIADTQADRVDQLAKKFKATAVSVSEIHKLEVDIFSPCATGGIVNAQTIKEFNCPIIAGAANVQIKEASLEAELKKRGIIYAPDFAINAGGVIFCAEDFESGGFQEERLLTKVDTIYQTINSILTRAQKTNKLAGQVALEMAKERINH